LEKVFGRKCEGVFGRKALIAILWSIYLIFDGGIICVRGDHMKLFSFL